ncbi:DNA repair endonuclease XPF [Trichuris trichiura]|uniref:DNA repair endonuclease XPF n=1 Tax=Trichuris trichiura TaxID=36087 RepID=A0A077ZLN5_TRITR|nr:DNA repair endonuclease XPF [Trichuris trichiura]
MPFRYLPYEDNVLVETFSENFLLITGKGVSYERLFCRHLELYTDSSVLALVLGAESRDHRLFCQWLRENGHAEPKRLTSQTPANDRRNVYLEGSVKFVTSNILVNDFLADRVPLEHLTCILIYRAHAVFRSALDAFLLGQIRKKNANCLVKAFSDQPLAFAQGIGKLQRAATLLQVDKVRFLPRFHIEAIKGLEQCSPVEEFEVQMTAAFRAVEGFLRELLTACVQELRQCSTGQLPSEVVNVDLAGSRWFDSAIKRHLGTDPQDILSSKALQLISDIARFRQLINCLESQDGRAFSKAVKTLFTSKSTFQKNSGWLFTDAADKLFKTASSMENELPNKWDALSVILGEIYNGEAKELDPLLTVIFVNNDRAAAQLKEHITACWLANEKSPKELFVEIGVEEIMGKSFSSAVLIQNSQNRHSALVALYSLHPCSAIIYNADLWLLRQLEVYCLTDTARTSELRIFFLMYTNSMEEERYLKSVSQERVCFEQLFKEELALVITKNVDAAIVPPEADQPSQSLVIVDMREFRSDLPTNLHIRGLRILPSTLTVGDYILAPHICVERKATNDLIGSLIHGRLYSQCEAMCSHYKKPVLLIQLENFRRSWHKLGDRLAARLVCLTLKFPQLSLVWTVSSLSVADLFIEFKWNRPEPDAEKAINLGKEIGDQSEDASSSRTRCSTLLHCLPGMGEKNAAAFTAAKLNLRQLFTMDKEGLSKLASSNLIGSDLYNLFNDDFSSAEEVIGKRKRKI